MRALSIIDLTNCAAVPIIVSMLRVSGTAGNPVNHVRIALSRDDVEARTRARST